MQLHLHTALKTKIKRINEQCISFLCSLVKTGVSVFICTSEGFPYSRNIVYKRLIETMNFVLSDDVKGSWCLCGGGC